MDKITACGQKWCLATSRPVDIQLLIHRPGLFWAKITSSSRQSAQLLLSFYAFGDDFDVQLVRESDVPHKSAIRPPIDLDVVHFVAFEENQRAAGAKIVRADLHVLVAEADIVVGGYAPDGRACSFF